MIRVYQGQSYAFRGEVPHRRGDGGMTKLSRWFSNCADCGEPFETLTPTHSLKFEPSRRCQLHKRPGQKVGAA